MDKCNVGNCGVVCNGNVSGGGIESTNNNGVDVSYKDYHNNLVKINLLIGNHLQTCRRKWSKLHCDLR